MELIEQPSHMKQSAEIAHYLPAHLQPAAYGDTHPQLAALVASIQHALPDTPGCRRLLRLHSQQLVQHYALSLLLYHTQQALAAHSHRIPRLAATLHAADLSYCLHSQGLASGIAGVSAEDVSSGAVRAADEYTMSEERQRLTDLVEQRMAAQLETMRAVYEDEDADVDGSQQEDGDKENTAFSDSQGSIHNDAPAPSASLYNKPKSSTARPVSAAFVALTSPPSASAPLSPHSRTIVTQLQHRRQLLQRQHVALQLHLLSLHSRLLSEHRLSAVHDNDTAQVACLKAKAHCLALKLQLMTAHADLLEPDCDGGGGVFASVWTDVLGRLEARRAELVGEVERVEGARRGYEAVQSGMCGEEWHEVSTRWRDVQRQKREKQWALKQLAV